jgi:hypothetical protein
MRVLSLQEFKRAPRVEIDSALYGRRQAAVRHAERVLESNGGRIGPADQRVISGLMRPGKER